MAADPGVPPGEDDKKMVAPRPTRGGKAPPIAVEAGAPPGGDGEKMVAPMATQEADKTTPMAVEAGASAG